MSLSINRIKSNPSNFNEYKDECSEACHQILKMLRRFKEKTIGDLWIKNPCTIMYKSCSNLCPKRLRPSKLLTGIYPPRPHGYTDVAVISALVVAIV